LKDLFWGNLVEFLLITFCKHDSATLATSFMDFGHVLLKTSRHAEQDQNLTSNYKMLFKEGLKLALATVDGYANMRSFQPNFWKSFLEAFNSHFLNRSSFGIEPGVPCSNATH